MAEPKFLLDSDICIYVLDGVSDPVRSKIEECAPGEVATSAIAFAEVMRGVSSRRPFDVHRAMALFNVVKVLPFEEAAAIRYRDLPCKRGTFDRLIAAHALALDLTFVTNNEADFADVQGLRLENWTAQ